MRIERVRPQVLQLTMHVFELAPLIAAARWAVQGGEGKLPADAKQHLQQVLAGYDDAMSAVERSAAAEPARTAPSTRGRPHRQSGDTAAR